MSIEYIDFLKEEGIEHGTQEGFDWGCRCDRCGPHKKLRRNAPEHMRTGRNGKPFHPNAPHGTTNAYVNYRCRCHPCIKAGTLHRQQLRKAKSCSSAETPTPPPSCGDG